MVRAALPLLTLVAGCTFGRPMQPLPPTVVRASLADGVRPLTEKSLTGEGWQVHVIDTTREGQTAVNDGEEWDETRVSMTFTAHRPDGPPTLLGPADATPVLRGLRTDIRKLVTTAGGEVLDSAELEAYRERSMVIGYKIDKVSGWVRAAIRPATDRPDETINRLDITVREQPLR